MTYFKMLLGFLLCVGFSCATDMKFLVVVDQDRPDVRLSVDKAITDINADTSVLPTYTITADYAEVTSSDLYTVTEKVCSSASFNWSAVIDATVNSDSCILANLAQYLDTPFITTSGRTCFTTAAPSVRPPDDVYLQAAAAAALSQNATRDSIIIMHDDSFGSSVLLPVQDTSQSLDMYLYKIPSTPSEILALLSRVKKETTANDYIVMANKDTVDAVLSMASGLTMMSSLYHWFIVSRDLESLSCSSCASANVVHVHHSITNSPAVAAITGLTGVPTDHRKLDAIYAYEAVEAMGKTINIMVSAGTWTAGNPSLKCYQATDIVNPARFKGYIDELKKANYASILGLVDFKSGTNAYVNLDVDNVQVKATGTTATKAGTWNPVNELALSTPLSFLYKNKAKLRVMTTEEPPFVFVNRHANGTTTYSGYSIAVLEEIATRMNFDYEISEPPDGYYGALLADGTWNGMVGELVAGRTDMVVAPLTMTAEREEFVDFTIPYYDFAGLQILMKKPPTLTFLFKFMTVFYYDVWLCIGGVLTVMCVLVYLFDKFSPYSYQNRKPDAPEVMGRRFTIKESMWFAVGSYTLAGEGFAPRATSGRLLVAGFWFFCTIMMSMYTANLAAFNTVSRLTVSVASMDELAAQTEIKYSTLEGSAMQTYFKRMKDIESNFYELWKDMTLKQSVSATELAKYAVWEYPLGEHYTDIWKAMSSYKFVKSSKEGMERVFNSTTDEMYAYIHESPMVKYEVYRSCDLTAVGDVFSSKPYGIALQQNSPFTKQVNEIILVLERDRILERKKVDWWDSGRVTCPAEDTSTGVTMDTLGGVFIFMAIGIGLALLILGIEILWDRHIKSKKKTNSSSSQANGTANSMKKI